MIAPAKKTTTNNNVSKNVNDTSENLPDKSTEDVSEMLDSSMEEETSQEPSDGTTQETDMSQDPAQETEVTKSGPGRPARLVQLQISHYQKLQTFASWLCFFLEVLAIGITL